MGSPRLLLVEGSDEVGAFRRGPNGSSAVKSFIIARFQEPRNTLELAKTLSMKDARRESEIPLHINTTAKPSISHLSPKLRVVTPHSAEDVNMWRDVFAGNPDFIALPATGTGH